MGLFFSKLVDVFNQFSGGEQARILMLGLDAAGNILHVVFIYINVSQY